MRLLLPALILCLVEQRPGTEQGTATLQPPYAALLTSWVTPQGSLAVSVEGDTIDLTKATRQHLVFIWEHHRYVKRRTRATVSTAVFQSLAHDRVGVLKGGGNVTPPSSEEEFYSVPALRGLVTLSGAGRRNKDGTLTPTLVADHLEHAVRTTPPGEEFLHTLGWEILLALRHVEAHAWTDLPQLTRNGFTAGVAGTAVHAAVEVLASKDYGCFCID